MITKYFHAPWNYQMNLLVSLWFLFCFILFSFGTNLWPHVFTKNTGKAFIRMTKINCTRYSTGYKHFFFFFLFWESTRGIKRKHILHFLVADQSTGFLARSWVPSQCFNSREIGKTCQQKWRIQHQNHDDYDFLIKYENETLSTTRLITLVFLNALEHQSTSLPNLTR